MSILSTSQKLHRDWLIVYTICVPNEQKIQTKDISLKYWIGGGGGFFFILKTITLNLKNEFLSCYYWYFLPSESADSIYLNSMYICFMYVCMYILVDPRKRFIIILFAYSFTYFCFWV